MSRPLRVEFEDAIYHLCARGNARQAIFRDEQDRARFVELLSESAQRFEGGDSVFCLNGQPFSSGRANASAKPAALDALAAGFIANRLSKAGWSLVAGFDLSILRNGRYG